MKNNRFTGILIVALTALALWSLWPTYQQYSFNKKLEPLTTAEDSLKFIQEHRQAIDNATEKSLKLGLDLKGGMYLVLEVDLIDLIEQRAWNKDQTFRDMLASVNEKASGVNTGIIDLLAAEFRDSGIRMSRYFYDVRDSDEEVIVKLRKEAEEALARAREVIRNRVDQYGVAEPVIQTQGARRIIVALPGVSDQERVRKLLKGTAKLEFKLVRDREAMVSALERINKRMAEREASAADSEGLVADANPLYKHIVVMDNGRAYVPEYSREYLLTLFEDNDIVNLLPKDSELRLSAKSIEGQDGQQFYDLYLIKKTPELTGGVITEAKATFGASTVQPEVTMKMNADGTAKWARITGANIGRQIAIVLDGAVYSAPVVESKIPGGSSVINGIGSLEEAQDLEIVLKAGALPAPVRIIEERTVGPSLGADYIRSGLLSSSWGLSIVAVFMIFYYRKAGVSADIALVLNILFVLSVLAGFGAALTLPGIAGLVLTIGMAVDANVLIFERIREELMEKKNLRVAVDTGYSKAFSAIIDSQITTLGAAFLLYVYGIGPIQGFAITLMIGTAASLFTALVVTKSIFDLLISKNLMTEKSFG
ncbi:MAG: protein translocase subunit SecD [Prosthecochloris sp.]|uniref:Protein translocase subunit SecD n=1 Tax=Prosthecochloris aestuarii (strain DSM 271 / SK 413) TaxID=290512 RepID=B4S946_PROA2|nr:MULTISPECIES: protein translocase subunit SecD [Prosthecochloris]ACF45078.1 protein-export membrane protein SecD [Prosthecochloris aestuarii DSM 271]MCW8798552.1 protein translocase subunit SecD [Prosthecochloris sp.]